MNGSIPISHTDEASTAQLPAGADAAQLERLLRLREAVLAERSAASSPGVARALEMADYYLFLGLTYFGYSDKLFPEQA